MPTCVTLRRHVDYLRTLATRKFASLISSNGSGRVLAGSKYQLILADPPWCYDFTATRSRRIENHYATMDLGEIMGLPVLEIAADDAVLYLWGTAPKLPEALAVMKGGGSHTRRTRSGTKA